MAILPEQIQQSMNFVVVSITMLLTHSGQSPDKVVDFCGKDRLADDGNLEVLGHDGLE